MTTTSGTGISDITLYQPPSYHYGPCTCRDRDSEYKDDIDPVELTLDEALLLRKAAKADPKLGAVLHKLADVCEVCFEIEAPKEKGKRQK